MTVHFESVDVARPLAVAISAPHDEVPTSVYATVGKRLLDISLVLLFSPVLLVVLGVVTVVLLLCGHNPVYVQRRIGKNGRVFNMLKFRTMVPDADARLREYLDAHPEAKAEWDRHQKLKDDPRITFAGRFLRKTSFDELPQVLNVLAGDMSLVGPRPMMESQRDLYSGTAYFSMRPGITGPWQISDRNDCEFQMRSEFDAHYARRLSLGTDVAILLGTVMVVLRGTGY